MRFTEIELGFDPLLIEFWAGITPERLAAYATRGGCGQAAADFLSFLAEQGAGHAEMIKTGYIHQGEKKKGWFRSDLPDTDLDAFTDEELMRMRYAGLDPRKEKDRIAYIRDADLEDEFRWIPHAWVEMRNKIFDPSGFLPNGKGQFDGMITTEDGLQQRYHYFK